MLVNPAVTGVHEQQATTNAERRSQTRMERLKILRRMEEDAAGPPPFRVTLARARAKWPEWEAWQNDRRARSRLAALEKFDPIVADLLVDIHLPQLPPPTEVVAHALDLPRVPRRPHPGGRRTAALRSQTCPGSRRVTQETESPDTPGTAQVRVRSRTGVPDTWGHDPVDGGTVRDRKCGYTVRCHHGTDPANADHRHVRHPATRRRIAISAGRRQATDPTSAPGTPAYLSAPVSGRVMELAFQTKTLRSWCEDPELAPSTLKPTVIESLKGRLADLHAAESPLDLVAGAPILENGRYPKVILHLADGYQMTCAINHANPSRDSGGKIVWSKVRRMKVMSIKEAVK